MGIFQRRVVQPLTEVIRRGVTTDVLAMSISLGFVGGARSCRALQPTPSHSEPSADLVPLCRE
jgi:hypothetical protein